MSETLSPPDPSTPDAVDAQDEYEIAKADDIEDETLSEDPGPREFSISSYGADYTVDTLVKRMRDGAFEIPAFQREFVWTLRHSSQFIESLLMGLPVPGIFLYRQAGTNKQLVVDGQQRLETLRRFYDKSFHDKTFRLVGVEKRWSNKTYDELDAADRLKLDDSIVHATVFKQDHPKDELGGIVFVFQRINSGGIRLSAQEVRNCVMAGPFTSLIKDLNKNSAWRGAFKRVNNRSKDEELIARFLALYTDGERYGRPMDGFLNNAVNRLNKVPQAELDKLRTLFERTIMTINDNIPRPFRPEGIINAAVLDSVMVGVAKRITSGSPIDGAKLASAYLNLLDNATYMAACARATADGQNVRARLEAAINTFATV
jgi:hypothetical protein